MDEFIEDATGSSTNAAETENRFFDGVEAGIGSLSKLDQIIDRVREDSEEMEIVSLNAMTVALKSGSAGRAFSVITDELKRLSGKTIQHANDLSSAGTELLDGLDSLRRTLGNLARKQEHFFGTVKETLDGGFKRLDAEVDETAATLRALASQASGVREPVSEIMQGVQLQDIIRQSLDHVRFPCVLRSRYRFNGNGYGNMEWKRA
jgi:methyl-accepting chemotaxis protein